jgi:hypothetical protein
MTSGPSAVAQPTLEIDETSLVIYRNLKVDLLTTQFMTKPVLNREIA